MSAILSPIVSFAALTVLFSGLYVSVRGLAPREKFPREGKGRPYACGEDVRGFQPQVTYRGFFVFAMFFTIIHVAVLVLATVPKGATVLATLYLAIVSLGLYLLMRKEDAA